MTRDEIAVTLIMTPLAVLVALQVDDLLIFLICILLLIGVSIVALRFNPFIPGQIKSDRARVVLLLIGALAVVIKLGTML